MWIKWERLGLSSHCLHFPECLIPFFSAYPQGHHIQLHRLCTAQLWGLHSPCDQLSISSCPTPGDLSWSPQASWLSFFGGYSKMLPGVPQTGASAPISSEDHAPKNPEDLRWAAKSEPRRELKPSVKLSYHSKTHQGFLGQGGLSHCHREVKMGVQMQPALPSEGRSADGPVWRSAENLRILLLEVPT